MEPCRCGSGWRPRSDQSHAAKSAIAIAIATAIVGDGSGLGSSIATVFGRHGYAVALSAASSGRARHRSAGVFSG